MNSITPSSWIKMELNKFINVERGYAFKSSDYVSNGNPIIRVTNISTLNMLDLENDIVYLSTSRQKEFESFLLKDLDFLLVMVGASIGKYAKVKTKGKLLYLNQNMWRLSVKNKEDNFQEFAIYALQKVVDQFLKKMQGSASEFFTQKEFGKALILTPPLPEQKKIASILTSVDEVIENTQKQIDKLQDLKKATMNELLTKGIGHTEFKDSELGRIPMSWNVKKLIEVGKCVRGLTFAPENVANNGLLVLRSSNIQDGSLSFKDNVFVNIKVDDYFLSKDGDILICVRNGSRQLLGKSALITGNIPISTHGAFMTVFRTDNYKFVKFLIQSDWFFTQVSRDIGATINSINNNNLLDYRFAFPLLNEQLEISKILDSIEKQIDTKKHKLSQTQFLKKSLMQDLLTGKVRVSVN